VSNLGQASYDEADRPVRLVGVVQDITERKQAEEELRHSRRMLDVVVSAALDAVIVVDSLGNVALWNAAAERIFGYSPQEAAGRNLHELIAPPRLIPAYRDGFLGFSKTGGGLTVGRIIEMIARRKDGVEFPAELSVAPVTLSGVLHAVGVVRDISRRKNAEAALRESEQRWQFALEGSGDGVWDWHADTNRTYFSRQWKSMLGYEEEEISDRPTEFEERVHPDDLERVKLALEKHFAGETPAYVCEYRLRTKSGAYKWVLGRGRAIERAADGRPLRVIGTHADLTALKAAEAERERLQAQVLQAQKMESIGRLAGGVAHDFNNLLTLINGHSAMLLSKLGIDDPIRDSVEQILSAGESAAAVVRQLLAFSRKNAPSRAVIDLNDVVRRMEKTIFRLVGHDIRIATNLAEPLPRVFADSGQIEQVLMNLVVNARDAMPNGGALTVETGAGYLSGRCAICESEIAPGDYVSISVRDTGAGMDAETLSHVFEPFFTTKPVGEGTGLGLPVVHGIVIQHNGHLSVASEPGAGSEFRIHLPVARREMSRDEPSVEAPAHGGETILLVDDDDRVRRFLVNALGVYGYRVRAASDAGEALAILSTESVDLMVTDIAMPKVGGYELASRARELRPELKVVFMSGHAVTQPPPNAVFIHKPFLAQDLARKVRQALGAARRPARILVVDDEPAIRTLLRSMLEPVGYEVNEASDGNQALAAVERFDPHLVITDLVMPHKEGIETIAAIRQSRPSVRILAFSGQGGSTYPRSGRRPFKAGGSGRLGEESSWIAGGLTGHPAARGSSSRPLPCGRGSGRVPARRQAVRNPARDEVGGVRHDHSLAIVAQYGARRLGTNLCPVCMVRTGSDGPPWLRPMMGRTPATGGRLLPPRRAGPSSRSFVPNEARRTTRCSNPVPKLWR
jgi:PAS domain S-box-containing protein